MLEMMWTMEEEDRFRVMVSMAGMMMLFTGLFLLSKADQIDNAESVEDDLNVAFKSLSKSGRVKKENTGFTFLDVEDNFIWKGVEVIKKFGFREPPYFGEGLVGAHISLMDAKEGKEIDAEDILDMEVIFDITSYAIVKPYGGEKEYFVAKVKAKKLEKIREDKGLEKIRHSFHITLGIRNK